MHRLETLAPELVDQLRAASSVKQRAAAIAAAGFAVESARPSYAAVDEARESLRVLGRIPAVQKASPEALVSQLDNDYGHLQEASDKELGPTDDSMRKFAQARAVSAVLFAAKPDAFEASIEATYEAAATSDDAQPLFAIVQSVL